MDTIEASKNISIKEAGFSNRTYHVLRYSKIYSLGDLTEKTMDEIWKFPHLCKSMMIEILEKLDHYGLSLKDE